MATIISFEESLEFPVPGSLEEFRRWALSDDFPEQGRIDFIAGRLEIDMSPEDIYCHGVLKGEIYLVLGARIKKLDRGLLLMDRTRLSCPEAQLSVEPDILFVSHESLADGRTRHIPKAHHDDRYIQFEGVADLIVEVVSDSSVYKDTTRLPAAYHKAGVKEYWLIDARADVLRFEIYGRGAGEFEPVPVEAEGYQLSLVMGCRYRLQRRRNAAGNWAYDLQDREAP